MMLKLDEAYSMLKDYKPFSIHNLRSLCQQGLVPCEKLPWVPGEKSDKWAIDESFIERAVEWRKKTSTMDEVIEGNLYFECVPDDKRKHFKDNVKNKFNKEGLGCKNEYSQIFQGRFIAPGCEEKAVEITEKSLMPWRARSPIGKMHKLKEVYESAGISEYQAKEGIKGGTIKATFVNGLWYVSSEEKERLCNQRFEYIGIYDYVKELNVNSAFNIEDGACRFALMNILRKSSVAPFLREYKVMETASDKRNALYFPSSFESQVRDIVEPYLKNYGNAARRIDMYESDVYWEKHPVNSRLVADFVDGKVSAKKAVIMAMLVGLQLPEITECTDDDILNLFAFAKRAYTKTYAQMIPMFLSYCKSQCEVKFEVDASYKAHLGKNTGKYKPYPADIYMQMGYMCFNQNFINEHDLINKAIESYEAAVLWLYCMWQYLTAWRNGDFFDRLPKEALFSEPADIINRIKEGTYDDEAKKVSALLEHQVNSGMILPEKTEDRQNERALVIHIPGNVSALVGKVYSICVSHGGVKYFKFGVRAFRDFFGPDYTRLFGNEKFMSRRAVKNFLDELAEETERGMKANEKVLGYIVCSYTRAHADHGGLSSVTNVYLSTKLDGYSDDQIVYNLLDAGACSFAPYMLLKVIYGEKFESLSLPDQTKIIKEFGITPYRCEQMVITMRNDWNQSTAMVNQLLSPAKTVEDRRNIALNMAKNLGLHNAVSRELSCSCLYMARGQKCPFEQRECLTCPASVLGKSAIFCLFDRLREKYRMLSEAKSEGSKMKYRQIIDGYLAKISEYLNIIKEQRQDIALYGKILTEIIIGGEDNANV